jgi:hypothetical protein
MLQVLVVSAGVGLFFVVLGALAIRPDVVDTWGIPAESALLSVELFESDLVVTETLLKVATGIAAITGLYYAISILTDATYRKEFLDGVIDEMRGTFAARVEYLRLRSTTVESKRQ